MSYKQQSPLPIVEGGTGTQLFEMAVGKQGFGVILCGVVSTSPLEVIQDPGSAGQVLTSNGIGVHPTFQSVSALGAVTELTGDTGGAVLPSAGNINIIANVASLHAGSSVSFSGSGSTLLFNVTDSNNNTIIGLDAGRAGITGTVNTIVGESAGALLTTGTGSVMIGDLAGSKLTTGGINTLLGTLTGFNYTGNEHSNICIGYSTEGTTGENNTLRIGDGTGSGVGQLSQTFISGIAGVNVGSVATVVTEAGDKLGTAVITAGSGITVTPGANTITIAATGGGGGVSTLTGDTGGAISPSAGNINIIAGISSQNSGSSVSFVGSGSTLEFNITDANTNTIVGRDSGNATMTGPNNVALGSGIYTLLTSADGNIAIGQNACQSLLTGENNIIMGFGAGNSYTGSESSNILLNSIGSLGESNVLRIGNATGIGAGELNAVSICGIDGADVGSVATVVTEANDQLGTAVLTAGSGITITPGANIITIAASGGGGGASTFPTDNGTATQSGGTLNIIANIATLNAGSTVSFSAPGSTDIVQLNVTDGSGNTIIGLNSGNAGISGSNNTVLGSNSATTSFSGNSNVVIGADSGIALNVGSGNTIVGHATGTSLTNGSNNTFIGSIAGNSASGASSNVCIGSNAGGTFSGSTGSIMIGANTGGSFNGNGNILIGNSAASSLSGGAANNVIIGPSAGVSLGNAIHNVFFGLNAANSLATGVENVVIGTNAGTGYGSNESSNIAINDNGTAPASQSNTLVIGAGTGTGTQQLNHSFIHGIRGITPASADGIPVFIGSTGQLGTVGTFSGVITSITGDTGGAQTGPAITFAGGTTGLSFGGSSNTFTTTFAGITANGGTVSLATDATTSTVNVGTGAGVKTVTVGSTHTTSPTTIQAGSGNLNITSTNGTMTVNAGTGPIFIGNDATNSSISIGNGAGVKTVLVGSTNSTSNLSLQSGTGAITATTNNGLITINSGTGLIQISSDSTATGVGLGTGAGAKTVTVGSVNTTSSLTLQSGSGGITTAGVFGKTVGVSGIPVVVDNTGLLGTVVSARRFKHNINPMADDSDNIYKLNPVTFAYNSDPTETKQYGLIAEEVYEVFPDLVVRNHNGEIETVQYHVLPALLLNEIKKLNARIAVLEARL